ncbi:hypothetical protein GCM10007216_37060 [Thalassobacillus devorans]|uniref:Uncharacterized protein n=1 Tax=Thalassobacillus devorans TaxID=279813 RepID=A0ABQ1PTF2_9BACI|nr:hypothetical protein GCM10007216_37060 [Thalassobacillus devorans]
MKCEIKTTSLFNYPLKVDDIYNIAWVLFFLFEWVGWETGRLPREKDLGEIPQGDSPRKLARSPAGKRVVFQPTLPLLR